MGYTEVSFLLLILNYSYASCYHWGKLGEGCVRFRTIFASFCESLIISKKEKKEVRERTDAQRAYVADKGQV